MYVNPKYHDKIHPSLVSHNYSLGLHQSFSGQGTKNYSAHITAGYAVGEYMESIGGIVSFSMLLNATSNSLYCLTLIFEITNLISHFQN